MANIPSEKVLYQLFNQRAEEFANQLAYKLKAMSWDINVQLQGEIRNNQIYTTDTRPLAEAFGGMIPDIVIAAVFTFIEIISESDSTDDMSKEIETLKRRMGSLESQFLQNLRFLPADWEAPSGPNIEEN